LGLGVLSNFHVDLELFKPELDKPPAINVQPVHIVLFRACLLSLLALLDIIAPQDSRTTRTTLVH
jgi:hypothetical protein